MRNWKVNFRFYNRSRLPHPFLKRYISSRIPNLPVQVAVQYLEQYVSGYSNASKPKVDAKEAALASFADRLTASRVGNSRVIEVSFSSRSPERAAQIANALANAYILDQLEAKNQANRSAATWLQERLHQLKAQGALAERAVLDFKLQNNIVAPQGQLVDEKQVADLNSQLVAARSHTSDLFARLNRIETIIGMGTLQDPVDAAFSDALTSTILTGLRQQYLELTRREADWSKQYGKNHSAVVSLRSRIQDIRTSTFEEIKRLSESYKTEYEIAKTRPRRDREAIGRSRVPFADCGRSAGNSARA